MSYQVKAIPPKNENFHEFWKTAIKRFGIDVGKDILSDSMLQCTSDSFSDDWRFTLSSSLNRTERLFFEYELRKFLHEQGWEIIIDD